ncbi:LysE family translocator [Arenibaculum sp.]|uniref:LysE family translocator n=1 Tax=Arenibaculum sp. TaxID=2865862 RepID=UPI002E109852|nr:LysE family translocator [Arenibaculum sp.]
MTTSLFLSMAAFALAASLSPGPVNVVALSAGARYGLRASIGHVTGATIGFTLLLLLTGLGLHRLVALWPPSMTLVRWAGVAFLLFMAFKLAADDGQVGPDRSGNAPSLVQGAVMQWLNPKAWLAALAGMGAYAAGGEPALLWQFALIYFVVCYCSIACWAYAGACLGRLLREARHVRLFNRAMAALLAASAAYLAWS